VNRFLSFPSRKIVEAWIAREPPATEIPWTPIRKPLTEATVALVTTAAVALKTDRPFDQEGERRNPWWGDPTCRVLPRDATERDVALYHLHIDTSYAERDLNCVLPLQRLVDLETSGEIGRSAPSHYSFMGYLLDTRELIEAHLPAVIRQMQAESVDVALLVPV
jgi:D-proline reductase (dithiol) PrdB